MILIDSLYINTSGGVHLLEYLVQELIKQRVDFYLLADARCYGKFDTCKHVRYVKASLWERKKFYKNKAATFSSVLCFGNIPAPIKLDVPVYTYFHNINLLTLTETDSISNKMKSWMKRQVFRYYKNNTDYWFVQTENTANELIKHLDEKEERIKLMPFFEIPAAFEKIADVQHGNDYVFVSDYTGAKGHEELLEAWRMLHQNGIDNTLHLTVHERNIHFIRMIADAQRDGVNVINHGFIPFEEIADLYKKSKAIIYPSHNESLGLGIVEAITAGCDVIGADLPYIHTICIPSGVFNLYSVESIANAVTEYEKGSALKSKLLIRNQINEMIEIISKN